jgi:HD-GYP domain-containing protein (c-di-GMP phosphodiesterase class II)
MEPMPLHLLDRDILVPGRSLPFDIVDSKGQILLPRDTPLSDEAQIHQLRLRGYHKEEEEIASVSPAAAASTPPPALPPPSVAGSSWRRKPGSGEMAPATPRFFQPVERLALQLEDIFSDLLNGKGNALTEQVMDLARSIQAQSARDADAFLASLELCSCTRYGTLHAIHSATLCDLVAQSQGMRSNDRRVLIGAALTRDVGFLELQEELELQSDPLSRSQRREVETHPRASASLLREAGVTDPVWLACVEQHHERLDGSGYPRGLRGAQIQPQSGLLCVADTYSAMVKPRVYRAAIQGPNAIHSIFQIRDSLADETGVQSFIRVLGVYPPGLIVRLASREIAVVTRRTENLKAPEVRVVADSSDRLLQIYHSRDILEPEFAVQEILARTHAVREHLNHRQLWGERPLGGR